MSGFSEEQLRRYRVIAVGACIAGFLTVFIASVALAKNAGVPEFLEGLRGSGWTTVVVGAAWVFLASLKLVFLRHP